MFEFHKDQKTAENAFLKDLEKQTGWNKAIRQAFAKNFRAFYIGNGKLIEKDNDNNAGLRTIQELKNCLIQLNRAHDHQEAIYNKREQPNLDLRVLNAEMYGRAFGLFFAAVDYGIAGENTYIDQRMKTEILQITQQIKDSLKSGKIQIDRKTICNRFLRIARKNKENLKKSYRLKLLTSMVSILSH